MKSAENDFQHFNVSNGLDIIRKISRLVSTFVHPSDFT